MSSSCHSKLHAKKFPGRVYFSAPAQVFHLNVLAGSLASHRLQPTESIEIEIQHARYASQKSCRHFFPAAAQILLARNFPLGKAGLTTSSAFLAILVRDSAVKLPRWRRI
jgi:hypothetical protein